MFKNNLLIHFYCKMYLLWFYFCSEMLNISNDEVIGGPTYDLRVVCYSEVAFLWTIVPYTELCTLFLFSIRFHFTNTAFVAKGHHSHRWNFIQWTGNLEYYENSWSSITICWAFTLCKFPRRIQRWMRHSVCLLSDRYCDGERHVQN